MCAVCFNGLQAVPVAAIAARAWWVRRRGDGVDPGDAESGRDRCDEPAAVDARAERGDREGAPA